MSGARVRPGSQVGGGTTMKGQMSRFLEGVRVFGRCKSQGKKTDGWRQTGRYIGRNARVPGHKSFCTKKLFIRGFL